MSQLGQMFSRLGEMFSGAGNVTADGTKSGPVNYDLARQLASSSIGFVAPVGEKTSAAISDAVHLAETWLDGALSPKQLQSIYGADPLTARRVDGTGETVGIVSLASLHGDEFGIWSRRVGLSEKPSQIVVVPPAPPGPTRPDWSPIGAQEVAARLQMTRAMAPGAALVNYETANQDDGITRWSTRSSMTSACPPHPTLTS